jgi:ABC-type multidrug transport system ATPase subunit
MQLFLRQLAGLGVSQVISGHSLDEILPLADRVLVLREGRSAYCEDIATFRSQMTCDGLPSPAFKNLLLGAAPAVSESQSS